MLSEVNSQPLKFTKTFFIDMQLEMKGFISFLYLNAILGNVTRKLECLHTAK